MKKFALFLLPALLLLNACKPAEKPDVIGWRWGMSVEEVAAKRPEIGVGEPSLRDGVVERQMGTLSLLEQQWRVTGSFRNDSLIRVTLDLQPSESAGFSQKEAEVSQAWSQVLDLLTTKYGKPYQTKGLPVWTWELPRTEIILVAGGPVNLCLTYEARPGYDALDKL